MTGSVKAEPQKKPGRRAPERLSTPERAPARRSVMLLNDIQVLSGTIPSNGAPLQVRAIQNLQRTIGNRATGRVLERFSPTVQAKLTVGQAGDAYEREAGAAADRVTARLPVQRISRLPAAGVEPATQRESDAEEEENLQTASIQRQEEEEEPVQMQPSVGEEEPQTATVQSKETEKEETVQLLPAVEKQEDMQTVSARRQEEEEEPQVAAVQRQEEEEEVQAASTQPHPEEEELQAAPTQPQGHAEELQRVPARLPPAVEEREELQTAPVQRMCPACEQEAQRQDAEEEEPLQAKGPESGLGLDTAAAERAMARSGSGDSLSADLRGGMEASFGADFSGVRVHTGPAAQEANNAINARAFTHGADIYIGRGESATDTRLMAHELTHAVQQGSASTGFTNETTHTLRREPDKTEEAETNYVFKIKVTKKHSADEFLAIALSQISRKDIKAVQAKIKEENWRWEVFGGISDEDIANRFSEVIVPQSTYFHWTGILLGGADVGKDPNELLQQYSEVTKTVLELPKEEQDWVNKEADKRFWEASGYKPGKKLNPKKSKQDAAMAELWLAIRQQVLQEIQEENFQIPESIEDEEPKEEIHSDWEVLERPDIAKHYLKILEHYARVSISGEDKKAASNGLTEEETLNIIGGRPLPRRFTDLYTQGYNEFETAGGSDLSHFFRLETTIIEQYRWGNNTAIRNQLRIGYGQPETDILGIVHRPDGTLYYNDFGQPLRSVVGLTYRDPNYVGSKAGSKVKEEVEEVAKWAGIDLSILSIDDPVLRLTFQVIRQSVSEPLMTTAHAADVYMRNIEDVNQEVAKGLTKEIKDALEDMLIPLIGFLAGHGVAHFLMMSGVPVLVGTGLALKSLLQAAGYLLSIQSGAEATQRLLEAAYYLTRVEGNEEGELTELSQSHLKSAAKPLQRMVAEIVITAVTLSVVTALKSGQGLKLECTQCELKGAKKKLSPGGEKVRRYLKLWKPGDPEGALAVARAVHGLRKRPKGQVVVVIRTKKGHLAAATNSSAPFTRTQRAALKETGIEIIECDGPVLHAEGNVKAWAKKNKLGEKKNGAGSIDLWGISWKGRKPGPCRACSVDVKFLGGVYKRGYSK